MQNKYNTIKKGVSTLQYNMCCFFEHVLFMHTFIQSLFNPVQSHV